MQHWLIFLLGFIAQGLFASRMLSQWILSEKKQKVATPVLFWQLSLLASFLMFLYGWIRLDFSIMFGQILTYFVYIRNMQLQGEWKKLYRPVRHLLYAFPFLVFIYSCSYRAGDQILLFDYNLIPQGLLLFGMAAQFLFILRFVYQWFYSEKNGKSSLPLGFWILSLAGSSLIFIYAVIRIDYVLLAGHSIGIIVYSRNIYLHFIESKTQASQT
jgi:lipid-A-disaccharide synthase-like uncharacterized protein